MSGPIIAGKQYVAVLVKVVTNDRFGLPRVLEVVENKDLLEGSEQTFVVFAPQSVFSSPLKGTFN